MRFNQKQYVFNQKIDSIKKTLTFVQKAVNI